ncbi:Rtf2 RING-finger-domain-containing protein [Massariosphaeria phaeospora]|uniref:Rtf2 RING-finger-domain-containing protein n=1 Tax=Massariosphaeria phaeospora TaxID=100035 RepID=A0A7C8MAN4_9PLEO|nr:Rtf2 RING-finger-domain-containing protein [Massariosphaeria phaeospora]
MDALWGFAAKIPATGPSAANAITYITILNATRQNLLVNVPKGETEEEGATRREQGIVEGRRLWEEVIGKWRNADIIIEEELVCAMGRLLLVGSRPRDWDDVLSLVEQTMDIPRLVPRLGTPARHEAGYPHLRAPNVLEQYRYDDDHLTPSEGPARGDEFLALTTKGMGGALSNHLTYARPSNNTLSMVQEACQKVVALKAADEYWEVLTDPTTYGVIPDVNSMHMRLRIFRQNRASASALKLLEEGFIANGMQARAGTFRIAMSTCVRDKNNHNSLKHASQILNIMTTTLEDANPKAVTMYADLVTSFPIAKGADIIDALTLLRPISNNIRLQLGVGGQRKYGNGVGATYLTGADRADAMMALRKIYGVYDRLFRFDAVAEEQKGPFLAERAKLGSFIQRIVYKDTNKIQWSVRCLSVNSKSQSTSPQPTPPQHHTLTRPLTPSHTTMGNDGGSIPTRRELVKEAAKALTTTQLKEVQNEQQEHAWSNDPLTRKPLARPVVSDAAGILYNKDSIIEYLLADESDAKKTEAEKVLEGRVRSLKDVVEVKFDVDASEGAASSLQVSNGSTGRAEKWVCPIANCELGPGAKAVYLVPCGHAFAGNVVKEVSDKTCLQCNEPYAENDIIPILPTVTTDVARLSLRAKTLREKGLTHALKKAPGSKKRKKTAAAAIDIAAASTEAVTITARKPQNGTSSSEEAAKQKEHQSKDQPKEKLKPLGTTTISTSLQNASTAYLTKKVLEEQDARNKRRKLAQNDNVNSLFSQRDARPSAGNSADYMTRGFSIGGKK